MALYVHSMAINMLMDKFIEIALSSKCYKFQLEYKQMEKIWLKQANVQSSFSLSYCLNEFVLVRQYWWNTGWFKKMLTPLWGTFII